MKMKQYMVGLAFSMALGCGDRKPHSEEVVEVVQREYQLAGGYDVHIRKGHLDRDNLGTMIGIGKMAPDSLAFQGQVILAWDCNNDCRADKLIYFDTVSGENIRIPRENLSPALRTLASPEKLSGIERELLGAACATP